MNTKTRQQALAQQKNPVIRKRLEAMTDAEYDEPRAKFQLSLSNGSVTATAKRLVKEAK